MQVTLAGVGGGTPATLTAQCAQALAEAHCVLGAPRLLQQLPLPAGAARCAAIQPAQILAELQALPAHSRAVVVYSGDSGFYSGARALLPLLAQQGIQAAVLPGISSVQLLAARLGRPWQDWKLVSAHGVACNEAAALAPDRPTFFLTGGQGGAAGLCARLAAAGCGQRQLTVAQRLSYPDERLYTGTAQQLAAQQFDPLAVVLAEPPAPGQALPRRTPGWPDDAFVRGQTPMTKQMVRAAALAKLAVRPGDVCWDIGAGTGSVSVELAAAAAPGAVYAVECDAAACELVRRNRARFAACNLTLTEGRAPQAIAAWPAPDVVFIGGSKGQLAALVALALDKNPAARICVSAIALQTLAQAMQAFAAHGIQPTVTQVAASEAKPAGALHLLMAANPVFLICGGCDG